MYSGAVHRRDEEEEGEDGQKTRRVRARHFHAGPAPPAALVSATPVPPTQPVLYADALASVFYFLDLYELAAVLRVSHAWGAVVRDKMASAALDIELDAAHLPAAAQSSLARHIGELICGELSRDDLAFSLNRPGVDCACWIASWMLLRRGR